jgi:hypothetical protein
MANNNININITASDNATPTIQKIEQAVSNLGKKATASISITGLDAIDKQLASLTSKTASQKLKISTGIDTNATTELKNWGATAVLASTNATNGFKNFEKQLKETGSNIDNIGSRLRYLSLVMSVAFAGGIVMLQKFISSAKEAETAEMKLMVAAQTTGETYEKLSSDAQKLVSATGGMLNLADASETLSNAQMALGDSEKSYLWALRMVDTAMVKKQNATDSSAEAVKKASIGLLTYREVMYDSAGAEIRFKEAEKEFAKEFNNGNKNLTERQKRLALYNATMKQTEQYSGMASLASSTFSGSLTKMNANVKMMQTNLGNAITPLFGTLALAVDSTASKISNFSREHSGLTMAIIAGAIATTGFVTVVAGAGALVEMLSSSIGSLGKMFTFILNPAILKIIIQLGILIGVIGGLTYAWLKLTNRWDIWKNKLTVLGQKIKNSIDAFKESAETADDTAKKLQKSIDNLQTAINDATADFNQQMSEWVVSHDKNISKLKSQIRDLKNEYSDNIKEIKDDWNDAMDDLTLSHARKTEDLQEQIDEEVSKGIWADQTKIKNLRKELARENEDYALAQAEKTTTKEDQLLEETKQYDEKLKDYERQLKEEEALEAKHSAIISKYRIQPYLDEVEKMVQNRNRQLRDQAEQIESIKEMYGSEKNAIGGVSEALNGLGDLSTEVGELQVRSLREGIEEWWNSLDTINKVAAGIIGIGTALLGVAAFVSLGGKVYNAFAGFFLSLGIGNAAVGFSAVATKVSLLTKAVGILMATISTPVSVVILTAAALTAIGLIASEWNKLKNEMEDAQESATRASQMTYEATNKWQQKFENGEISYSELQKRLKTLGTNNWSNTGTSSYNPFQASGGPIIENRPYIVGEEGPELFIPNSNGYIASNDKLGGMTITNNISINNPSVRSDADIKSIAQAVKDVISRELSLKKFA